MPKKTARRMFRRATRRLAVTLTAAISTVGCLPPSGAMGTPRDVASTHAYILANHTLARAGVALIRPAEASAQRAIHRFRQACPNAGVGSPQDEEAQRIGLEVAGALWSAAYSVARAPIQTFVRAVQPLRWSNPRLTRLAHLYASSLHGLATLPTPDLCGDVAAWRASGYTAVPASTIRFDRLVDATEDRTIPPSLLGRYEQPGDRSLVAQTTAMETTIRDHETAIGFEDWNELLEALSLPQ